MYKDLLIVLIIISQINDLAQLKSRSATVVVAANNSRNKEAADFIVPDGADDAQTTIRAALSSIAITGGKLILLEGTYECKSYILSPNGNGSNITVEGQGIDTIIKVSPHFTSKCLVWTVYSGSISFSNLVLDGNNIAGVDGIWYDSSRIKLRNVVIKNFGGCGINTRTDLANKGLVSASFEVINCLIVNNGEHGVRAVQGYGMSDSLISGGAKIIADNFIFGNGKSAVNTYNNIELVGLNGSYSSYACADFLITGNTIRSNNVSKYGINFGLIRSIVKDNNLNGAGVSGNISAQYQSGCIVDHNII